MRLVSPTGSVVYKNLRQVAASGTQQGSHIKPNSCTLKSALHFPTHYPQQPIKPEKPTSTMRMLVVGRPTSISALNLCSRDELEGGQEQGCCGDISITEAS